MKKKHVENEATEFIPSRVLLLEAFLFGAFSLLVLAAVLVWMGFSLSDQQIGHGLAFADWPGHHWTYWHLRNWFLGRDACFSTCFLFHPVGIQTVLIQGNLLISCLAGLIALFTSVENAYLLTALLALLGNGVGGYALIRTVTGNRMAGAVAGLLLLLNGYAAWAINTGNIGYENWFWICLHLTFLYRVLHSPRVRYVIPTSIFASLAVYSNFVDGFHLPFFSLILTAFFTARLRRTQLLGLALVVLLTAMLLSPLAITYLKANQDRVYSAQIATTDDADFDETHAQRTTIPEQTSHGVNLYLPWNRSRNAEGDSHTYYFQWILAGLGLAFCRKRTTPWLTAGLVFFILSLGPFLQWFDGLTGVNVNTGVPLPFLWLHDHVPLYFRMQFPARIFSYVVLATAIAAGFGAKWLTERSSPSTRMTLAPLIVTVCLVELIAAWPLRFTPTVPVNPFYRQIAAGTEDFAIIEVPFNFANLDATYLYYQIKHERPVMNGMFPPMIREDPTGGLLCANALLANIDNLQQQVLAPWSQPLGYRAVPRSIASLPTEGDLESAVRELVHVGFRYLVLHRFVDWENGRLDVPPDGELSTYLYSSLGAPVYVDDELVVFDLRGAAGSSRNVESQLRQRDAP